MRLLHLIYIICTGVLLSGNVSALQSPAYLLPKKQWEVGLFQPLKFGFSDRINFSTHPVLFFVMPNISIKAVHRNSKVFSSAARYDIYYPTKLLKTLQTGSEVGGETASLIAPGFKIPHMIGFSGDYIVAKPYKIGVFSMYAGVNVGLVFGNLDSRASIDLPLVYHRLGVFHNRYGIDMGFDFFRQVTKALSFNFDIDLKFLPGLPGSYSFENKLLLFLENAKRTRLSVGYKYVYGEFPHGMQGRLLPYLPILESWVPIIDIQWSGKRGKYKN